ncbi:hypothetical protein AUP68_09865 [Ilyonectria robusta]
MRAFQCSVLSSLTKAAFTYYGQTGRDFATTILSNDEPTPTNTGESGNIGAEISSESNGNEPESRDSGSNTAAMVGGAVGGLAVVSLLVLGVLFLRRRPYKQRVTTSEPTPSDPVGHTLHPPVEEFASSTSLQSKHPNQASVPVRPELHGSPEFQPESASHNIPPQQGFIIQELPTSIQGLGRDKRHGPQQV